MQQQPPTTATGLTGRDGVAAPQLPHHLPCTELGWVESNEFIIMMTMMQQRLRMYAPLRMGVCTKMCMIPMRENGGPDGAEVLRQVLGKLQKTMFRPVNICMKWASRLTGAWLD